SSDVCSSDLHALAQIDAEQKTPDLAGRGERRADGLDDEHRPVRNAVIPLVANAIRHVALGKAVELEHAEESWARSAWPGPVVQPLLVPVHRRTREHAGAGDTHTVV